MVKDFKYDRNRLELEYNNLIVKHWKLSRYHFSMNKINRSQHPQIEIAEWEAARDLMGPPIRYFKKYKNAI